MRLREEAEMAAERTRQKRVRVRRDGTALQNADAWKSAAARLGRGTLVPYGGLAAPCHAPKEPQGTGRAGDEHRRVLHAL